MVIYRIGMGNVSLVLGTRTSSVTSVVGKFKFQINAHNGQPIAHGLSRRLEVGGRHLGYTNKSIIATVDTMRSKGRLQT